MFAIVCAEKGSYDSNIKISTLGSAKNKPEAIKKMVDFLADDVLMKGDDSFYEKVLPSYDKEELKKELSSMIERKEKRIVVNSDMDYIQIDYNRQKIVSGYTIPCSSLNEYIAKTIALVSA